MKRMFPHLFTLFIVLISIMPIGVAQIRQEPEGQILIMGKVRRPQIMPLKTNSHLLRAISMAGGITNIPDDHEMAQITILRLDQDQKEYSIIITRKFPMHILGRYEETILMSGDIVLVGSSAK